MRKYLIPSAIIILASVLIFSKTVRYELSKKINIISAGSYAWSETYNLPYSEERIIKAIEKFKEKNPQYIVPELEDSRTENGLWFVAYFYNPRDNKIFNVAVRGNESGTALEFASVNDGLQIGNSRDINKDFSFDENQKLKNEFEEFYFNPLKRSLGNNKY